MVVRRKSKTSKYRGSKTHGWGSMKKHRGAGNRGGRGRAGFGKRGDHRQRVVEPKKGFFSRKQRGLALNLSDISKMISKFKKEGDFYVIDASSGISKILGTGNITHKIKLVGVTASEKAKQKIKTAGGENVTA